MLSMSDHLSGRENCTSHRLDNLVRFQESAAQTPQPEGIGATIRPCKHKQKISHPCCSILFHHLFLWLTCSPKQVQLKQSQEKVAEGGATSMQAGICPTCGEPVAQPVAVCERCGTQLQP